MIAGSAALLLAGCGNAGTTLDTNAFRETKSSRSDNALAFLPTVKLGILGEYATREPTCMEKLAANGAVFIPVPDVSTPHGCGFKNAVIIISVGSVRLTGPAVMQCQVALKFSRWVSKDVQPAARSMLGMSVARIKVSDHYNCRLKGGRKLVQKKGRRIRKPARRRMSQHAFANAVDVSRIWLADGRESHVMLDWHGPMRSAKVRKGVLKLAAETTDDLKKGLMVAFWRTVARRACGRFTKVLTPEYNWLHRHHIHMDTSPGKRCTLDGTAAGGKVKKRWRGRKKVRSRRYARRSQARRRYVKSSRRLRLKRRSGARKVYYKVRRKRRVRRRR